MNPYWVLFASVIANSGGVTCDMGTGPVGPDGSRCHLAFHDTKYPTLKDCQKEAPAILKDASPFSDVTITWFCEKYDPKAELVRHQQSIILQHDKSRETE